MLKMPSMKKHYLRLSRELWTPLNVSKKTFGRVRRRSWMEKSEEEIVKRLRETEKPISATRFAKAFDVSRQIIVGDVALLRATGVEIVATARGYMLEQPLEGIERKIACQHTPEQTREELSVIVAKGGEVVDVSIAHPLYGELIGSLRIQSEKDIDKFMDKYQKSMLHYYQF